MDPPHARVLRVGRLTEPRVYLVTSVTSGRNPLFRELRIGRIVVREFRHEEAVGRATTLAFVVMPDHFHWLLRLNECASLAKVVGAVKGRSAMRINAIRGNVGESLWQAGFHDHAVRREENLADVARYVVANPIRAGLVRKLGAYPLWDAVWLPKARDTADEGG